MTASYTKHDRSCSIKSFDLNTRSHGEKGIPELNPADSFLIASRVDGHEHYVLIDAGKKGQAAAIIVPYLLERGIRRIDRMLLSHPHYDHFGGMIDLLRHPDITIGQLVYAPISDYCLENGDAGELNRSLWNEFEGLIEERGLDTLELGQGNVGDVIAVDGALSFDVIATPDESLAREEERVNLNNMNLVVRLSFGRFTALFPGDCGVLQTGLIVHSEQYGKCKDVFLLKAAHHGGDESTTDEFIAWCNPRIVIVTCNHVVVEDRPSFIRNMHEFGRNGAKIFRCDHYREIEIVTDGRIVTATGRTDGFVEHVRFDGAETFGEARYGAG